jgi:hypothetical protein
MKNNIPLKYNNILIKHISKDAINHYSFDDNLIDDISGKNLETIVQETGTMTVYYQTGKINKCINITHTDTDFDYSYIRTINNHTAAIFDHKNSFSMSVWIKTTQKDYNRSILSNRATLSNYATYRTLNISCNGLNNCINLERIGAFTLPLTNTIFDGNWHHLVCIYNNSVSPGLFVYVDNNVQPWNTTPAYWNNSFGYDSNSSDSRISISMGRGHGVGGFWGFNGSLDSLYVFNRVLYAYEVDYLWNNGNGR